MSSSSILLFYISSLTYFSSSINFSNTTFCSSRNFLLFFIYNFCSSLRFRDNFSYLNHSSLSISSSSFSANKCFFSAALHIIYRCKAGKLRLTICLKYSLIVLILSLPVAPILDLRLSMISLMRLSGFYIVLSSIIF